MPNWLRKIGSWFGICEVKPIPEAPKKDSNVEPIQKMLQGSGMINMVPPKKGRKKRNAQPPRK